MRLLRLGSGLTRGAQWVGIGFLVACGGKAVFEASSSGGAGGSGARATSGEDGPFTATTTHGIGVTVTGAGVGGFVAQEAAPASSSASTAVGGTSVGGASSGGTGGAGGGLSPLHTEGRWFKDANGNTVTLRGVALADLKEVDTGRAPMNVSKIIDLVSDSTQGWYAHIVRLTVFPDDYLPDPKGYLTAHLLPAIEEAAKRNLYAIVDWHEIDDPVAKDAETRAFWQLIAPNVAGYSNVILEMYNEVQSTNTDWGSWQKVAQPWVDLIRQSSKQIILIGGPNWDQLIGGAATSPFSGENLAYVGHIYPQIDPSVWSPGGDITRVAQTRPLLITEWGYGQGGDIPTDGTQTSFGDPFKAYVESNQIGWIAWCADTQWAPPIFDANWQPQSGQGVMGSFAKSWLADTNGK